MRRGVILIALVLAVWFGYHYFSSSARLAADECLAALEAGVPAPFPDPALERDLQADAVASLQSSARDQLADADDPEAQYAALLIALPARRRQSTFDRVLVPETHDPVLAWHSLRFCTAEPDGTCPLERVEARLLEVDSSNAVAWAAVASNRYARGDAEGALDAMRWAAQAPVADDYFSATVALLERALAKHTDLDYPSRLSIAFRIAASRLPDPSGIRAMCREQGPNSEDWAQVCLTYDERLERSGTAAIRDDSSRAHQVLDALLRSDPARLPDYLDLVRREGELPARRSFLEQNLDRVIEPLGLLECRSSLLDGQADSVAAGFVGE